MQMTSKAGLKKGHGSLCEGSLSRIIEMAWEDRTPFEAIETEFGLDESAVIRVMRGQLKRRSFENWRKRVTSRSTKHRAKRPAGVSRHQCPTQNKIRS
ncbi:MAG: TIGR03643 family protein [Halieaceae bacterium]